jgi:hypothetical protein
MNDIRMLAEGGLTLLLGRSGAGKSLLAAAMAADITRGREPATGAPRRPGRVLFLYGDDRPETAARRLEAAGAAMDRLTLLAPEECGLAQFPGLAGERGGIALIVFDPLRPFLDAPRGFAALAAVLAWAECCGTALLATAQAEGELLARLTPVARAAFLATRERNRWFLLPLRHPALTRPLPFAVEPSGEGGAPRLRWKTPLHAAAE